MPVRIKRGKNLVQLYPEGDMTIYQAAELKESLLEGINGGSQKEIEINLSAVADMDTAGFQLLVLAKREAVRHSKTLRLEAHGKAMLGIMDLYNMAGFFGDPVVITN